MSFISHQLLLKELALLSESEASTATLQVRLTSRILDA